LLDPASSNRCEGDQGIHGLQRPESEARPNGRRSEASLRNAWAVGQHDGNIRRFVRIARNAGRLMSAVQRSVELARFECR
jgi:hypothetical protein